MVRDLNEVEDWLRRLVARVSRLESGAMLENSSITNGRMRFIGGLLRLDSGAHLEVVGTTDLTGPLNVNGAWSITGNGGITGTQTNSGALTQNGPWTMNGAGGITGNVSQTGSFTLSGSGRVNVGTGMFLGQTSRGPGLEFDDGSTVSKRSYGLAVAFSDSSYVAAALLGAQMKYGSASVTVNALGTSVVGNLSVSGSITGASKSFKIPHPLKADTWLLHGVTESPTHSVEYKGEAVIGANGTCRIELPEYFPKLTLVAGRVVYVTGRGFVADWTDITDRSFTVTGAAGKRFSWLVKADRSDVILKTEEPM